jgi:Met-zincin/Domain of unknown function (DUF5117)/Domain of unknown function (DUF5118)
MRVLVSVAALAVAALFLSLPGRALAQSAADASATAGPAVDYDKFVKSAESQPGLFTVWRKDGKVYLEIRDDQLDTDFLEHVLPANGLGGFGFDSGQQFDQPGRIVRFHDTGKAVALVWPHTLFLAKPGTALATAVRESTADSVEAVLPVLAQNKTKKTQIVDASPLLGDILDLGNDLNDAVGAARKPEGAYRLDETRTYFGPSKAFPDNVIIEADQTFASIKPDTIDTVPDPRFVQMRVKYNFAQILSSPGYMPRLYDDRVGYWEDPHVGFDYDSQISNGRFYVLRWGLEPSDPTKPLSPPKKPIVYYLDRSIPDEYRAAVRDGILEWNKAFEKIGISNAIAVLDPPDDPAWDPDDIRYSVIRWITDAPSEFGAEAQIVWDPRSGEIFRGGVLLDSNLGRSAKFAEQNLLAALGISPNGAETHKQTNRRFAAMADDSDFGRGLEVESAFGATALTLMGQTGDLDEFVYERIKAVTMHEVGHDFGLSHNFIAHNAYSPDDLRSAAFTKAHGTSASVMDYWPVNLWPKGTSHGSFSPTTLGTYDYHVIHWGYAAVPGAQTPQDEVPTLARWASAASDPRYAFAGDEDGDFSGGHAVDPRAAPFLLTNKPIDWCTGQLDMTKGFIATLDRRFPQVQQPWSDERVAFLSLLARYNTCASSLTHYIAGEYLTRSRVGDPGVLTALSPVPRSEEWRAFSLLDKYLFAESNWNFSPTTLDRLTYVEYMPFSSFGYDPQDRHDVPVVEVIGKMQTRALASMFAPLVLERLADLPTKARPGTTMSLVDLFTWSQASIFGDLAGGSQIHRNLQRSYARMLAHMITAPDAGTPLDAQALARAELTDLEGRIKRSLGHTGLDLQTRAHLVAMQTDVERALGAQTVLPAG